MKKIVALFLSAAVFISVLGLSGCGEKKVKNAKKLDGATYEISLRTDINTGYDWKYTIDNKECVKITQEFIPFLDNGTLGKTVFTVKALKKGEAKIHFERTISDIEEPDAYCDYTVTVNRKLDFDRVESGEIFSSDNSDIFDVEPPIM